MRPTRGGSLSVPAVATRPPMRLSTSSPHSVALRTLRDDDVEAHNHARLEKGFSITQPNRRRGDPLDSVRSRLLFLFHQQ
jgi:hypothetical protein